MVVAPQARDTQICTEEVIGGRFFVSNIRSFDRRGFTQHPLAAIDLKETKEARIYHKMTSPKVKSTHQ